jgi:hypothetical protein
VPVLIAAHCVFDEVKGVAVEASTIKVAVGKYRRDWYTPDPYEQKRDVSITLSLFNYRLEHGFQNLICSTK